MYSFVQLGPSPFYEPNIELLTPACWHPHTVYLYSVYHQFLVEKKLKKLLMSVRLSVPVSYFTITLMVKLIFQMFAHVFTLMFTHRLEK
jgi:hypothetical protein